MNGWELGMIVLKREAFKRNPDTRLIEGFVGEACLA